MKDRTADSRRLRAIRTELFSVWNRMEMGRGKCLLANAIDDLLVVVYELEGEYEETQCSTPS